MTKGKKDWKNKFETRFVKNGMLYRFNRIKGESEFITGNEVCKFIESTISQTKQELIEKFLDDLGYAYIHDKDGRKNIKVLIGMYNIKLEELKKLSNK